MIVKIFQKTHLTHDVPKVLLRRKIRKIRLSHAFRPVEEPQSSKFLLFRSNTQHMSITVRMMKCMVHCFWLDICSFSMFVLMYSLGWCYRFLVLREFFRCNYNQMIILSFDLSMTSLLETSRYNGYGDSVWYLLVNDHLKVIVTNHVVLQCFKSPRTICLTLPWCP